MSYEDLDSCSECYYELSTSTEEFPCNDCRNGTDDVTVHRKTRVAISAPKDPLAVQVDGDHYKNMPIQPIEFCQRNKLGFCESNVVKYICRHKSKNGARDIHKAIHNLQVLLKLEYGEEA
jgi:hypothetical protein